MKKVARYIQLLLKEKEPKREPSGTRWLSATIPTKRARKNKPNTMSLRKHRKCGHAPSGTHNPKIKEAIKREAETNSGPKHPGTRWKSNVKELFDER